MPIDSSGLEHSQENVITTYNLPSIPHLYGKCVLGGAKETGGCDNRCCSIRNPGLHALHFLESWIVESRFCWWLRWGNKTIAHRTPARLLSVVGSWIELESKAWAVSPQRIANNAENSVLRTSYGTLYPEPGTLDRQLERRATPWGPRAKASCLHIHTEFFVQLMRDQGVSAHVSVPFALDFISFGNASKLLRTLR